MVKGNPRIKRSLIEIINLLSVSLLLIACADATPSPLPVVPVPSATPFNFITPVITVASTPTSGRAELVQLDAVAINAAKTKVAVAQSIKGATPVIKLWDMRTGKQLGLLNGHTGPVGVLIFSPDGKTLASGSDDETVRLWNVDTFELKSTLRGFLNPIRNVIFSPDGKLLAATGAISRIWNLERGTEVSQFKNNQDFISLTFSPDSRILATTNAAYFLEFYDVATGKNLTKNKAREGWACTGSAVFSQDNKTFYCYFGVPDNQGTGTILKWDMVNQKGVSVLGHSAFEEPQGWSSLVTISPSTNLIARNYGGSKIQLMETRTGKALAILHDASSNADVLFLSFTTDSHNLLTLLNDYTIQLWNIDQYKLLNSLKGQKN